MNLNQTNREFSKTPILVFLGLGVCFAILAIVLQDGLTRGYASIYILFLSFGLAALLIIAGIVGLALRRLQAGLEMIASALVLPAAYLVVLFVISQITGE